MKIRIQSDGTAHGTRVFNADTDEELTGQVKTIRWWHEAGKAPQVEIMFVRVDVDFVGTMELGA